MNSSFLSRAVRFGVLGVVVLVLDAVLLVSVGEYGPWVSLAGHGIAAGLLGVAAFNLRGMLGTLERIATVCEEGSCGNLESRIFEIPQPGVIGRIQTNINNLLDITDAFVRESSGSAKYLSQRKYFRQVLLRGLPGSFNHAARTLNGARDTMEASVDDFVHFAESNVGGVVSGISSSATQMRNSAQAMTQIAQELNQSVSEIGQQVANSSLMMHHAAREAERTNEVMKKLAAAADKVGEVVDMIQEIARKTNLLALNATIEAARAGEAGKAFAVVAGQVRGLADQTEGATEDISQQIAVMQSVTSDAVAVIKGIGETVTEMNDAMNAIASRVNRDGARRSVSEQITVTQAANDTGHAAKEVFDAASTLTVAAEHLSGEIAEFINKVRS